MTRENWKQAVARARAAIPEGYFAREQDDVFAMAYVVEQVCELVEMLRGLPKENRADLAVGIAEICREALRHLRGEKLTRN